MQKPINYTDFFQFFLHIPVAVFEDLNDDQIKQDCFELESYPIVIIRNKKHPLFVKFAQDFEEKGVRQELKSIILTIGYNNPYLS